MKSGNLNFLEPSGPLQACNGIALPLPYLPQPCPVLQRLNTLYDMLMVSFPMVTTKTPPYGGLCHERQYNLSYAVMLPQGDTLGQAV